ncbi:MAG: TolC family protein, partial [Candidatus Eremiobacteraeota bacterium]|nr:TolC family protein [Candidatus Eremiobacteraeota bacterium]
MGTKTILLLAAAWLAGTGIAAAQPAGQPTPAAPQVSLSLHDALQLALANNLTYQAALTDERAAEAQIVQARAAFQPTLNTGYEYTHTQNEGAFQFIAISPTGPKLQKVEVSAQNVNSVNATLLYALYTGGAAQADIGQAAAHLAQTQSDLAGLRNSLVEETTSGYFHLIQTTRSAQVADTAYDVASQDLKTANELYTAGTAAKVDVLRTQVTVSDARLNQIRAHNDVSLANARLANTLNINLGSIITPTDTLEIPAPSYVLDSLLTSAKGRPELAAAYDAVTIAQKAVQGARSAYLPNVGIQVQEASTLPNFVGVQQPQ